MMTHSEEASKDERTVHSSCCRGINNHRGNMRTPNLISLNRMRRTSTNLTSSTKKGKKMKVAAVSHCALRMTSPRPVNHAPCESKQDGFLSGMQKPLVSLGGRVHKPVWDVLIYRAGWSASHINLQHQLLLGPWSVLTDRSPWHIAIKTKHNRMAFFQPQLVRATQILSADLKWATVNFGENFFCQNKISNISAAI